MSLLLSKKLLRALATTSFSLSDAFYQQHGDLAVLITHASIPPLPPLQIPFSLPQHRFLPLPSAFKPVTPVSPILNITSAALFDGQCSLEEYDILKKRSEEEEHARRQSEVEAYKRLLDELEKPEVGPTDMVPYYSEPAQATPVELAIESLHQTIANALDAVSSIKKAIGFFVPIVQLDFPALHHPYDLFGTLFLFVSFVVLVHVLVFTPLVFIIVTAVCRLPFLGFKKLQSNNMTLLRIKKKNTSRTSSTLAVSSGSSSLSPSSSNKNSPPSSLPSHMNAASSSTSSNSLPPASPSSQSGLAASSSSNSSPPVSSSSAGENPNKARPSTRRRRGRRNRRN